MKSLIFVLSMIFSSSLYASVEVMFHPYDDTMGKIAELFHSAENNIDMALYNIDDKKSNPVINALMSKSIQQKIKSGDLSVRLIFEGYMSKEENKAKMETLEALGVDVRFLGSGKKMHHKFAIFDTYSFNPTLVTGSANWSMMSQRNYNENILFFYGEQGITFNFQKQFELLWGEAKEIGIEKRYFFNIANLNLQLEQGLEVEFNTDNFVVTDKGFRKSKTNSYTLTKEVVAAIDEAQSTIDIATTRLKLRPVYDAILRAAARGVQVKLIVTQGEYLPLFVNKKMKVCKDPYIKKCSTSQNFAQFLIKEDYKGKENVQVRVKYFDLRKDNLIIIAKQMHSKYMIIDNSEVLTGSFNWSYSAEYNHLENLIKLDSTYRGVVESFGADFKYMWSMERELLEDLRSRLERDEYVKCRFEPMALTFEEVDQLVKEAKRRKICQMKKRRR